MEETRSRNGGQPYQNSHTSYVITKELLGPLVSSVDLKLLKPLVGSVDLTGLIHFNIKNKGYE